jgi:hypothetical protein
MQTATTTVLAALGLASAAFGQTYLITPGGAAAGNGVFRVTPPAGVINPAGTGVLASGSASYIFSPNTVGGPNAMWRNGWFWRVLGENREYAFPNAAAHTAAGITVTRTGSGGTNTGTLDNCFYNYEVRRNVAGGYVFTSQQKYQIVARPQGPIVELTNTISNTGPVTINLLLYWAADVDCVPGVSDDKIIVQPFGLDMVQNSGAPLPIIRARRGNADFYAGRGGVGFPFGTQTLEDMTNGIIDNFNSTAPVAGGFDVTYGYQWVAEIAPGNTLTARTFLEFLTANICGASDVAGAGQTIGPDGQLTADDIIVFINWFFANDVRADVAGAGQTIGADGQFTADDIIIFINRFFEGC